MDYSKILDILQKELKEWVQAFIKLLPNMVMAILVILIGVFISKMVKRFTRRIVKRFAHSEMIANFIAAFVFLFCLAIVFFVALNILNLDKAVASVIAGAGIAGLALALAFQDVAANFMAGVFMSFRRPIRLGDIVKLKDYMGKVISINIRDTVILTFQGQTVIIPNKEVFSNPIDNYSLLGKRRMDLTVGVSYGEDLEKVKKVVLDAVKDIQHLSSSDPTSFYYEEFDDSSINFSLRMWISTPEQLEYLTVRSEAIIRIKKAFDENNITIPFPIRTLDFGIKGGKTLAEMPLKMVNS